jgi:hypothetical protein
MTAESASELTAIVVGRCGTGHGLSRTLAIPRSCHSARKPVALATAKLSPRTLRSGQRRIRPVMLGKDPRNTDYRLIRRRTRPHAGDAEPRRPVWCAPRQARGAMSAPDGAAGASTRWGCSAAGPAAAGFLTLCDPGNKKRVQGSEEPCTRLRQGFGGAGPASPQRLLC